MRWFCFFALCRFVHVANGAGHGIYQCSRCKTVSRGATRDLVVLPQQLSQEADQLQPTEAQAGSAPEATR